MKQMKSENSILNECSEYGERVAGAGSDPSEGRTALIADTCHISTMNGAMLYYFNYCTFTMLPLSQPLFNVVR